MTAHRDPDRLIHAFLLEGEEDLNDRVFDAVRAQIEQKPQRAGFGSWGTSSLNRFVAVGLGVAAVVVVLLIGSRLLGSPTPGLPGATGSAQPTASEPSPPAESRSHVLLYGAAQITVVIPADGWAGGAGLGVLVRDPLGADPPEGAGMITFAEPLYPYGDPCHWDSTRPATSASTVDELVATLAAQPGRSASEPVDITVDGYSGKSIILHIPGDLAFSAGEFTDCDQGVYASFGTDAEPGPARFAQGPGQIDELWVLDVNGVLVTFDTAYFANTPTDVVDELRAIVESATLDTP